MSRPTWSATSALPTASTPARAPRRRGLLRPGWPLYVLLYGYPLWWLLGVSVIGWIVIAVPAAFWLWGRDRVEIPKPAGMWALFLGWMLISASQLSQFDDLRSFTFRAAAYFAAGISFVYVYNLPAEEQHTRRLTNAFLWLFGFIIIAGIVAIVVPTTDFTTPFEAVLPAGLAGNAFVKQMVHGQVAQLHTFLGYPVPRPAAPFAYTNEWGAAVGIMAPVVVYAVLHLQRRRTRALGLGLLTIAMIPIIISLNRGLWLSLIAATLYISIRFAVRGQARPLMLTGFAGVVVALAMITTPLGGLALERLDTGHSDDRRASLVQESVAATIAAPVLGHGGPIADPESRDRAPVGTHGQVYLVGVSHGIPGVILYVGTLLVLWLRCLPAPESSLGFWANAAIFVALVQLPFYGHVTIPLQLILVFGALAMRVVSRRDTGLEPRPIRR